MRLRRAIVRRLAVAAFFAGVATASAAPVSVTDDSGRIVELVRPAARVVSLAPHATELFYEIGAGSALVAVTAFSDWPPRARTLPRIGGLGAIDFERLVALQPDLVVAWSSGTSPAEFAALERTGIPVFRSEPRRLDDIARTLERFGVLAGRDDAGRAAATAFRARVDALAATWAVRAPVRVFYQVWRRPLMTIGGPQPITDAIALCGGVNVFATLSTPAAQVDVEAVVRADPQAIVTAEADDEARRQDVAAWDRWPGVAAVRAKRYVFLDAGEITRPTSRMLDATEAMCRGIDAARR